MFLHRTERMKTALSYGLVYLLWIITLPLGGLMILDLRDMFFAILAIFTAHRVGNDVRETFYANLQLRAADTTSWLVVGVLLVILIIVSENILRTAMLAGQLWSWFFMVLTIFFGVLALTNLAIDLLRLDFGDFTWRGLFSPVIYMVLAGMFFWAFGKARLKENTLSSDEGR